MKVQFIDVDMDEVLVDFIGGACKAHGVTREQMESYRTPGHWSVQEALGLATNGERALTTKEFWRPINEAGAKFWESLEPFSWTESVVELVKQTKLDWYVVTSPSFDETSYLGKVRWLKNMFGNSFDRIFLTAHKHRLATGSLLIDDRESNLEKHIHHGGVGVLFPSLGNKLYRYHNCPLTLVAKELVKEGVLK